MRFAQHASHMPQSREEVTRPRINIGGSPAVVLRAKHPASIGGLGVLLAGDIVPSSRRQRGADAADRCEQVAQVPAGGQRVDDRCPQRRGPFEVGLDDVELARLDQPPADVALHREKHPGATIHVYPAGHGFNCELRGQDFAPESAAIAWATEFASGAVAAMGLAKRAIDRGLDDTLDGGLDEETAAFAEVFATEDAETGIASFKANGPGKATFQGR